MSRPLVYHYYGGKAGVFISALRQTGDDVVAAVAKAAMDDPDNWLTRRPVRVLRPHPGQPDRAHRPVPPRLAAGRGDRQVLDEIGDRVLRLIMDRLDPPGDSPVLQVGAARLDRDGGDDGRGWLRRASRLARNSRRCCPNCCAPSSGPRRGTTPP